MKTKRFLLIGKNGQVGWELQRTCALLGEVLALEYPDVNLADADCLRRIVREVKPDVILNPAAYTNVDKAESEMELARAVNAIGPGVLAEEAKRIGAALMHWSTDYVFDGTKGSPYVEVDPTNPLNVYGSTKLEGEQLVAAAGGAHIIFRTSWVYSLRAGGFVTKVLNWGREQEVMRVVDDQISSPTSAGMLAEVAAQVLAQGGEDVYGYLQEKGGLYHCANVGACSRYEWAQSILELDPHQEEQVVKQLLPAKSADFPTSATRPMISVLDSGEISSVFGIQLLTWTDQLELLFDSQRAHQNG